MKYMNLNHTVRQKILAVALFTAGIVCMSILAFPNTQAQAVTGSDFNPGNIIDNSVFFDTSTMTPTQIQTFLNSKVPTCDTNGEQMIYGQTRAAYGASQGHPTPFTCLKDFSQEVPTIVNGGSDLCTGSITGGTKSAAVIIYDAATACGINPQVLIVLLQKEQALITDDWPWEIQYRSATGFGCPDTAACDSDYYGFFNQVYNAAKAFRRYEANPTSYNFRANRNNFINYQANNPGCGGTTVFIENQATANLYIYTPYQPNQAALDNLYGTGDTCSAYGNRNFWRMFNDWFGSTTGSAYNAQLFRQSSYQTMFPGESRAGYLDYKNIGSNNWYDTTSATDGEKPINLATSNPINRASQFGTSSWGGGKNRPATQFAAVYEPDGVTLAANQHVVEPNQIARFEFTFTASSDAQSGVYREWFQPILESSSNWDIEGKAWLQVTVTEPNQAATFHSQGAHPSLQKNTTKSSFIKYTNTGNQTWYKHGHTPAGGNHISLATSNNINRASDFGATWGGNANRPAAQFSHVLESNGTTLASDQTKVLPGQVARFPMTFTASSTQQPGEYREWFQPIIEGSSNWDIGARAWLAVTVSPTIQQATFHGQCPYPTVTAGSSATCYLDYKNTGTNTWRESGGTPKGISSVNLATANSINRASDFGATWGGGKNRPATRFKSVFESNGTTLAADQTKVLPGQIARFEFTFTTSSSTPAGQYQEWFQPILEGSSDWNISGLAWIRLNVQ